MIYASSFIVVVTKTHALKWQHPCLSCQFLTPPSHADVPCYYNVLLNLLPLHALMYVSIVANVTKTTITLCDHGDDIEITR